jgi:hypothetical protein
MRENGRFGRAGTARGEALKTATLPGYLRMQTSELCLTRETRKKAWHGRELAHEHFDVRERVQL